VEPVGFPELMNFANFVELLQKPELMEKSLNSWTREDPNSQKRVLKKKDSCPPANTHL